MMHKRHKQNNCIIFQYYLPSPQHNCDIGQKGPSFQQLNRILEACRQDTTLWPAWTHHRHFSATFSGWRFRKESSSVSVFWRTVVYIAPRRRTLPRHYNGPPTCLHVVISGLPQRRLWSSQRPFVLHLATERFRWLPHAIWNSLPSSLRGVQSLTTFRHCLKTELFDSSCSSFTWLSHCTINMCVFSLILYSALATAISCLTSL